MTPGAGPVTLRPAQPDDEEFLRELFASTRAPELAALGDDDLRATFLALQYAARAQHVRAAHPAAMDSVVLLEGERAGRLWIERLADALWVVDIAIAQERRGAGIGTRLFTDLQHRARAEGRRIVLFAERDGRARTLYARLGFCAGEEQGLHVRMEWSAERVADEQRLQPRA